MSGVIDAGGLMITFDKRTKGPDEPRVEAGAFLAGLPDLVARNGELAGRGQRALGLAPLTLVIDDEEVTLGAERRTTIGLLVGGGAEVSAPDFGNFVAWDFVLRALLDGRPVHEAGMISFVDPLRARAARARGVPHHAHSGGGRCVRTVGSNMPDLDRLSSIGAKQ